jgi:hypothetical protein
VQVSIDPPVDAPMRRVLAELLRDRAAQAVGRIGYDDAWRRAGLQEGVLRDDVDSDYALSPRSTRGATRA